VNSILSPYSPFNPSTTGRSCLQNGQLGAVKKIRVGFPPAAWVGVDSAGITSGKVGRVGSTSMVVCAAGAWVAVAAPPGAGGWLATGVWVGETLPLVVSPQAATSANTINISSDRNIAFTLFGTLLSL